MNPLHMDCCVMVTIGMFALAESTTVKVDMPPGTNSAEGGAWNYLEIPLDDEAGKHFLSLFQNDITLQSGEHHRLDSQLGAVSWILIVLACIAIFAVMYIVMEISKGDKPDWDTSKMGTKAPSPSPVMSTRMASPLVTNVRQPPTSVHFTPQAPHVAASSALSQSSITGFGSSLRSPAPQYVQPEVSAPVHASSEIAVQEDDGGESMTAWLSNALQKFTPKPSKDEKTQTLVVQSHEGVLLQASDNATPHAENRTIIFKSLKGGNQVIRARLEEFSGQPRVLVESASGVPLASLDTSSAISRNGMFTQKSRRVNIHRVPLVGPPFSFTTQRPYASVVSIAPGTFLVTNDTAPVQISDIRAARNVPGFVLLVTADSAGYIQEMRDGTNDCVVRMEAVGQNKRNLWLRTGCDVALVVSVVLAVQKLG